MDHVPNPGQREREDRGTTSEVDESRGNQGLEKAFTYTWPA